MPKHAPSVYVPLDRENPPVRTPSPVPHRSAGRDLYAQRYVVGWPRHSLVKIGCSSNNLRVRRFARTPGAEVIDIAYYESLFDDSRSEVWLSQQAAQRWQKAFDQREDARFLLDSNMDGWTEFFDIPAQDWPELRRLAAI